MNRSAGYTLIEVLIMLAITAILAATVLETVRASTANGIRIEQAARNATQDYITVASVRRAIEASRPDYSDAANTFIGDETQFSALTSYPIISSGPAVAPYNLSLINTSEGVSLVYQQSGQDFQVAYWPRGQGRISYLSKSYEGVTGFQNPSGTSSTWRWSQEWPVVSSRVDPGARSYYQPLPLAVRITVSFPDKQDYTLVVRTVITAPPTPRIEDLIGTVQ